MILNANKIYLKTKAAEEYKNKKFLKETEKIEKRIENMFIVILIMKYCTLLKLVKQVQK